MQDELIRPKTGTKFNLESEAISGKRTRFEVYPESFENRKKAIFEFEKDLSESKPLSTPLVVSDHGRAEQVEALLENVDVLLKHKERELAKTLVYRALSIDSRHPGALRKAIGFLNPNSDLEKIIKIQKQICSVEKSFATLTALAHSFYKIGQDEEALGKYFDAIALLYEETDELFEVYKNVGNILTRQGDFDGAEEYYNKAFTLNPDSDSLLVNLGTLSIQREDFENGLIRFRKAIDLNPKNDRAWVGLALVHNKFGDFPLAMANVEKAIDLNPLNRTAVHLFANWSSRVTRWQPAIEKIEFYLAHVELDEEMSLVLIHFYCQINRFDLAKIESEKVLLWSPKSEQMGQVESELSAFMKGSP